MRFREDKANIKKARGISVGDWTIRTIILTGMIIDIENKKNRPNV